MAAKGEFSVDPDRLETRRQLDDAVAVGIPDAELARQTGEEPARTLDREGAVAVLAVVAPGRRAAQQVAEQLDAVADAENRHAEFKNARDRAAARPAANTLLGPPERMMPITPSCRSCSAGVVKW